MAQDAGSELARNILHNIIPLESFGQGYTATTDAAKALLQRLGVGQPPQQPAPPINAPLPRFGGMDANGQPIIVPPGR